MIPEKRGTFKDKKASMVLVYIILGLVVIAVMIPVIKYIKDTSDTKIVQDFNINPDDGFMPFDYMAYLTPEEKTVQNSIDALICAVNKVSNNDYTCSAQSQDSYDPKANYVCCKETITIPDVEPQVSFDWKKDKCPDNQEQKGDNPYSYQYEQITVNSGKCGDKADPKSSLCLDGGYKFGSTCVTCTNPTYPLSGDSKADAKKIEELALKCSQDFSNGLLKNKITETNSFWPDTDNYICAGVDTSKLGTAVITRNDISTYPVVFEIYRKDGKNEIWQKPNMYCLFYSDIPGPLNKVIISPCEDIGYTPPSLRCTIKAFELPQGDQKNEQSYSDWLKTQKAPRYLVYYEAFTPEEEMIWQENYGRVTTGAYVKAAGYGLMFGIIGTGTSGLKALGPKNIVKTFGNVRKNVPTLYKKAISGFSRREAKKFIDEFVKEQVEYGTLAASRKQYVRERFLDAELSEVSKKIGTANKNELEQLALRGDTTSIYNKISDMHANQLVSDEEFTKLGDLFEVEVGQFMKTEGSVARLSGFRKFLGAYRNADDLMKDYEAAIKRVDTIDAKTKQKILSDIETNFIPADIDLANNFLRATKAADTFPQATQGVMNDFSNKMTKYFNYDKGGINPDAFTNPETRNFFEKLSQIADQKIPQRIRDANYKPYYTKYVLGEILYLMEMQQAGIVDRYESQGANSINLGQPYDYGPKPQQKNDGKDSTLTNFILLLSRHKSVSDYNTPRFYLGSPCKTDLNVYSTICSCEVPNEAPLYYTQNGYPFQINSEGIIQKFDTNPRHAYWYDYISQENKKIVLDDCFSSWTCFIVGLKNPESSQAMAELYYSELFLSYLDWLAERTDIDNCDPSIQSSQVPLKDFVLKNENKFGASSTERTKYGFRVYGFQKLFLDLFRSKSADEVNNNAIYQALSDAAVYKDNGKTCIRRGRASVTSSPQRKEIFIYDFSEGIQQARFETYNQNSDMTSDELEKLYSSLGNTLLSTYNSLYSSGGDKTALMPYFEKIGKNYYFNYYHITDDVADTKKMVKSCQNGEPSIKNANDEIFKRPHAVTGTGSYQKYVEDTTVRVKTQCMYVEPINYAHYTNNGYQYNYCFTGDLNDGWKLAKEVNTYGWVAGDMTLAFFTGGTSKLVTWSLSGATAVAQQWVDGWIIRQNVWPQPKKSEKQ